MVEKTVLLGIAVIVFVALAYAANTYLTPPPVVGGSCGTVSPDSRDECCARQNADAPRIECVGGWKYMSEEGICEYVCANTEVSDFDGCVYAGNPVMESYPRQCRTTDGRTFTEVIEKQLLTEEVCEGAGGYWNTCSNKCTLMAQGKQEVACTMQCEQLCECAGMMGYSCPQGYNCVTPENVKDAMGYCTPDSEKRIGGQRDENGCLGPAGYSFDSAVGACTRNWEIKEDNVREAAGIAVEYVGGEYGLTVTGVDVARCQGCFTVHLNSMEYEITVELENWVVTNPKPPD